MSELDIDWDSIINSGIAKELVTFVRKLIENGAISEITPAKISRETNQSINRVEQLLAILIEKGKIEKRKRFFCPFCGEALSEEEIALEKCPYCDKDFAESDTLQRSEEYYVIIGEPSRDVRWLMTIHGMNTHGAWQEDMSWRLAEKYKYSAPVDVYKYGLILSGVIQWWKLNRLKRKLVERVKTKSNSAKHAGYGEVPDVIAHSLGTWLLGHVLCENENIRVGRVILTGCILRPDFDWQRLIDKGQVEAVLNHYGTSDNWPYISQYVIPNSGPSGKFGFFKDGVINVPAKKYTHGDFFKKEHLEVQLNGVWKDFLTLPKNTLPARLFNNTRIKEWRSPIAMPVILRAVLLVLFICLFPVIVVFMGIMAFGEDL